VSEDIRTRIKDRLAAQLDGKPRRKQPPEQEPTAEELPTASAPWPPPIPLAETPEADPFPVDVLPAQLARFVEAVAFAKNCPVDYAAVPLLVIAGAAIGASRALEVKQGWRERPCLYAAVIGPPGSAKTPALKAVAAPVYGEQARRLAHYRRQRTAWQENDEKGAPPTLETIFVNDITLEKLGRILRDNPRGELLIRDELTGWIGSMDQYRANGRGADRQGFLSIWAGEPIRVDRQGEPEPIYVPHPFVGIIGGLPPALLPELRGRRECWDGFLDRVLLTYPTPIPAKGEDWHCLSDDDAAVWRETLVRLWALQPEPTDDGESRPRYVRLTKCGRQTWERFTAYLAGELNRADLPEPIKGHLSKFRGYAARLALIVHCLRLECNEVNGEDVDGESIDRAARLIAYFRSHCLKVHAALGSDSEIEDARRVLHWIEREQRTEFKRWEVHKDIRNAGRFARLEDLDPPLERLVKQGYLRRKPQAQKERGRPADPVFEVNPTCRRENRANRVNAPAE
jgi:hypothetical protein